MRVYVKHMQCHDKLDSHRDLDKGLPSRKDLGLLCNLAVVWCQQRVDYMCEMMCSLAYGESSRLLLH